MILTIHRRAGRRGIRFTTLMTVALIAAFALPSSSPTSATASSSPTVLFVDGKHGSDDAGGRSLEDAFRTVRAGLWALRYGGTLNIVGYDDYVYYEKMTESQWFINGTSSSPVTIQAMGYGTTGYVRPIISGARVVSSPGDNRWTRPDPVAHPDVWRTAWTYPIPGYESNVRHFRQERVFLNVSQPLVRPRTTPTLADLQALPGSQYWDGTSLFVRLGGWGSDPSGSLDPNDHTIEVPSFRGILVASGSAYVRVQGFRIRHTTMGVGFTGTSHHNLAQDVDASYNYAMGFWTASSNHTFRRISGSRNTLQLVKLDNGARYNVVESALSEQSMGQGVKLTGASTAYNTIRDSTFRGGKDVPMSHGQYGGYVQGIDIEQGANNNVILRNRIERNRRGLMLYQVNSSGKPLSANTVRYNLFLGNDDAVVLWDGKFGSSQGSGAVLFYRNLYVQNRRAITSEAATSNKTFRRETIYRTGTKKKSSHSAIYLKAGRIKVLDSIVRSSAGYAFYAKSGARIDVSYTALRGAGLGARNSSTRVVYGKGVKSVDPKFLSVDPASPVFLTIDKSSPAYAMGSKGGPVGARWR